MDRDEAGAKNTAGRNCPMPRDYLIELIRDAFPPQTLPQKGITTWETIPDGEDSWITEQLRGRSWVSLPPEEIEELPACFLTLDALALLLPAFMIHTLAHQKPYFRIDEMQLVNHDHGDHSSDELAKLLTRDQVHAIVQYLLFARSRGAPAKLVIRKWRSLLRATDCSGGRTWGNRGTRTQLPRGTHRSP